MSWVDSSFNPLSIHIVKSKNQGKRKRILMIGVFYASLNLNPRNPLIKALIFSFLKFFGSLLISAYQKKMERSRLKKEHYLMLNLDAEKGAIKDRDQSGSSITRPWTCKPMRFVHRFGLEFGLKKIPYTVGMCLIFIFLFLFL